MPFTRDSRAQIANLRRHCSNPGAQTPHLYPLSLWPASASVHSMSFQERLSAAADPVNVTSSCSPIPRKPVRCHRVRLGEGELQPKHKHDLHGAQALPAFS